ncbi:MAG: DUF2878 domain-containing protein [Gammaproteobacteria bacterium]|nr:DUF2878 domain-containing protein [Gammaproteobacteria bacterium]
MLSVKTAFLIFNFLGLQATWAACAYGATHSIPNLGVIVGIFYIALHMMLTKTRRQDLLIILAVSLIGISIDHINTYLGLMSFSNENIATFVIPSWLITLWVVFSLMLPHSLNWLGNNMKLAFLLGGLGGSSSYWLGHKLGALTLSEPLLLSILILFIEWAIICPVGFILLKQIRHRFTDNELEKSQTINN